MSRSEATKQPIRLRRRTRDVDAPLPALAPDVHSLADARAAESRVSKGFADISVAARRQAARGGPASSSGSAAGSSGGLAVLPLPTGSHVHGGFAGANHVLYSDAAVEEAAAYSRASPGRGRSPGGTSLGPDDLIWAAAAGRGTVISFLDDGAHSAAGPSGRRSASVNAGRLPLHGGSAGSHASWSAQRSALESLLDGVDVGVGPPGGRPGAGGLRQGRPPPPLRHDSGDDVATADGAERVSGTDDGTALENTSAAAAFAVVEAPPGVDTVAGPSGRSNGLGGSPTAAGALPYAPASSAGHSAGSSAATRDSDQLADSISSFMAGLAPPVQQPLAVPVPTRIGPDSSSNIVAAPPQRSSPSRERSSPPRENASPSRLAIAAPPAPLAAPEAAPAPVTAPAMPPFPTAPAAAPAPAAVPAAAPAVAPSQPALPMAPLHRPRPQAPQAAPAAAPAAPVAPPQPMDAPAAAEAPRTAQRRPPSLAQLYSDPLAPRGAARHSAAAGQRRPAFMLLSDASNVQATALKAVALLQAGQVVALVAAEPRHALKALQTLAAVRQHALGTLGQDLGFTVARRRMDATAAAATAAAGASAPSRARRGAPAALQAQAQAAVLAPEAAPHGAAAGLDGSTDGTTGSAAGGDGAAASATMLYARLTPVQPRAHQPSMVIGEDAFKLRNAVATRLRRDGRVAFADVPSADAAARCLEALWLVRRDVAPAGRDLLITPQLALKAARHDAAGPNGAVCTAVGLVIEQQPAVQAAR